MPEHQVIELEDTVDHSPEEDVHAYADGDGLLRGPKERTSVPSTEAHQGIGRHQTHGIGIDGSEGRGLVNQAMETSADRGGIRGTSQSLPPGDWRLA